MQIDNTSINKQAPRRGDLTYPPDESEFEIQSFLYQSLLQLGYNVRGEVAAGGGGCRFDLVVFVSDGNISQRRFLPIRIIEVKARPPGTNSSKRYARFGDRRACDAQVAAYRCRYGFPVDLVYGMADARQYVRRAVEILGPAIREVERPNLIVSCMAVPITGVGG